MKITEKTIKNLSAIQRKQCLNDRGYYEFAPGKIVRGLSDYYWRVAKKINVIRQCGDYYVWTTDRF